MSYLSWPTILPIDRPKTEEDKDHGVVACLAPTIPTPYQSLRYAAKKSLYHGIIIFVVVKQGSSLNSAASFQP